MSPPAAHPHDRVSPAGPSVGRNRRNRLALAALLVLGPFAPSPRGEPAPDPGSRPPPPAGPLTSAQARETFETDPGLVVECVAAEPLVRSPAAFGWDESGRLLVAENPGYPVGPGAGRSPDGAVVELADTDGDGRADRRTVFAEGFSFPNGLMSWRGGWLVTDAPNLWWLADTNRDGRAEVRELWFTGFATNQTTQLRACYPIFGPDGWIYVARGWSAGVLVSPKWPNLPPVDLANGDFRFRPDGSAAETVGGNAQFGMVIDDAGRRFTVSNRNPLMHAVVHPRWWRRYPGLPATDVIQDVSPTGYEARVSPRSPDSTTAGYMAEFLAAPHAGTFTAACGIHQFHGEGLPAAYQGNWFICEPAQNLVQRQLATPDGPSFRSRRQPADRDFLTSTDPWFRPVYAATGPDGALYLADLYRKVIDHPDYLPAEMGGKLDFDAGKEMGRIWRIRSRDARTPPPGSLGTLPAPPLGEMRAEHLAVALSSINGWVRQTAHRLLFERGDPEVWNAVLRIATNDLPRPETLGQWDRLPRATEDEATGRHLGQARRLWLLGTLGGPAWGLGRSGMILLAATFDPSPTVRETAWRVWQTLVTEPKHALPDVPYEMVYTWADDPNPAVRFQFALLAGEQEDWSPVVPALARIARRDGGNRWTRTAVLSGLKGREEGFVRELFQSPVTDTPALADFAADLARLLASEGASSGPAPSAARLLLARSLDAAVPAAPSENPLPDHPPGWALATLRGFADGLRSRGGSSLADFVRRQDGAGSQPPTAGPESRLVALGPPLLRLATDPRRPAAERIAAIRLLAELGTPAARERLWSLLIPAESVEIQVATVRALVLHPDPGIGSSLVEPARWNAYPPPVRDAVLAALTGHATLLPALFDALERGDLPIWSVDPQRRKQLQNHSQPALRERARKLFADAGGADRRQVLARLLPLAGRPGSGLRGHDVFVRTCATCHRHSGEGAQVGPDLTGVRNQPAEALLLHILVPDAEVAPGFEAAEVETRDGRSLSGLVVADSPETITLRLAGGAQETLRRSNVTSLTRSRMSLMPQELEKTMSEPELVDLLAFLRGQP